MGWIRTMALGALGFGIYSSLRQRSRRAHDGVQLKPEPLQRWEGEGGNVTVAHPALATPGRTDELPSAPLKSSHSREPLNG